MKRILKHVGQQQIMILIIMLLSACLSLFLATKKEGMHNDEYSTYKLANAEEDERIFNPTYGVRLDANEVFESYFYPNGFSLKNVWLNQKADVHPPLYYLFFHIFILLTHHFLELKTGILLNIVIHMINIVLVWLVLKEMLLVKNMDLLGTILYAFLPSVLGNVMFIRMYVLLSTFMLAITLLFAKEWNKSERKVFYLKLGLLSVAGTMTHYYFLIYLFYCCVVWGIYIISRRKWKELSVFIGTMAASGVVCLLIFPYMLQHIFESGRGQEAFAAVFSLSTFISNGKVFWKSIDNVYSGFLLAILVLASGLLMYRFYIGREADQKPSFDFRWFCIFFACTLYVVTVAKVAPYSASRYIAPIYAICVVLLMGLFDKIVSAVSARADVRWILGVFLLGLLLNNGYNRYTWPELYRENMERTAEARTYGANNECIYIISKSYHGNCSYPEFIQYRNITFIQDIDLDLLYTEEYAGYDHVVMYIDRAIDQKMTNDILGKMVEMNPGLDSYKELHASDYNDVYYLD